jgi:hypothetical protein
MKKNETHQEQVTRILNEMVLHGEVVTKLDEHGELLYMLAEPVTVVKKQIKKCRSAAAKKAWVTRRRTETSNKTKTEKKAPVKAAEDQAKKRLSEIAKKAWVTRRLKSKGNPAKREERLAIAKELLTGKTQVKYKVRKETIRSKPDYVSFDQHLERAWEAYEASVKKALLRRSAAK